MHPLGSRFVYQEAGENVLIKKSLTITCKTRQTNKNQMWALTDSNRRPSACKADALNQLS